MDVFAIVFVSILALIISYVILHYIIKSAVKSALKEEVDRISILIEWALAKQYPDVENIRGKSERMNNITNSMREQEELVKAGRIRQDKFQEIKAKANEHIKKILE